jgi:NAD(P)-dependent dehydrogenase (short-subunit alcohol dehydrogenase family)
MQWTAADIPDLRGKVAIVTGSSAGIGFEIALALARHGARVIVASRDEARTKDAASRIAAEAPAAKVEPRVLDLASLASVRRFAEGVHAAIDILVNNAGVSGGPRRETVDGLEVHFQVNYLAHFALTHWLMPRLRAGARVVSISSDIASKGRIDFDDLQCSRGYTFIKAYAQSKLANLLFAFELQRQSLGFSSFAAHPGVAKTDLLRRPRRGMEHLVWLAQVLLGRPAGRAALPALFQATSAAARPDAYVGPTGPAKIPERALDLDVARRLWEVSVYTASNSGR